MSDLAGFWFYADQPGAGKLCKEILRASRRTSPGASSPGASSPGASSPGASSPGASSKDNRGCAPFLFASPKVDIEADIYDGGFFSMGQLSADSPGPALEGGRYQFAGDIRIDNCGELAAALNIAPTEAAKLSDFAILMSAWQQWGYASLERIAGSFAIAVWDAHERVLFLARDPAGERPLYYHSGSRYFAFASTARALLQCPEIDRSLDETHLALALCGVPREPSRSWLKAVNCVEPGHCLVAREGSVGQSAYWRLEDVPDIRLARDEEYVEAFLELFDEAVRCCLRAPGSTAVPGPTAVPGSTAVPGPTGAGELSGSIAAELSGGLDSSSVCATAARLLAQQGRTLTAFTSVPSVNLTGRFTDRHIPDEGPAAAEVARLYPNIEHKLVTSAGSNLLRELRRTHPSLDSPMKNPLNHVWLNLIQEQASRDGATVLLNGQRGNITISTPGMLRDVFHRGDVFSALRLARQHNREWAPLFRNALKEIGNAVLPRWLRPLLDSRSPSATLVGGPINPQLAAELHMLDRFREFILKPPEDFRAAKWRDFNHFEVGDFHHAAQSSWGIDRRDPTSDKRVLAFCLGIPMEQYVAGGINCSLIRRAMRGRLPESVLNQPRKGMQSGDWYESLTAILPQMVEELGRIERSSLAQRILDLPRLRDTLEHWPTSAAEAVLDEPRYHAALTRGMACGYFLREFEGVE